MKIAATGDLPLAALEALIRESQEAGWRHLLRLRDEWLAGINRFDAPGEGLFLGWDEGVVVAVGGLNIDPDAGDPSIGRVRRVYVRREARRRGRGRLLVQHLVNEAQPWLRELRLGAGSGEAGAFFESLGFERASGGDGFTHRRRLVRVDRGIPGA